MSPSWRGVLAASLLLLTLLAGGLVGLAALLVLRSVGPERGLEATAEAQRMLLLALVAALAPLLVVAVAVARALAEPIQRLRADVSLLAGPSPRHRVRRPEWRDLGELADGVNLLAERGERARREVEGQLVAATRELASEKDTLASILFALADGVVVCNAELRVVLSNAAARRMLSLPVRPLRRGESIYSYLEPALVGPLIDGLGGGEPGRLERGSLTLPSGAIVELAATTAGSEEVGRHYVFVLRDVTRQVAEDRSRDRFLAETVQRLRSPAASLLSVAEILRDHEELDEPRRREFLDVLLRDAERLADELDAMQAAASAGLAPSWAGDVALREVVERVATELHPALAARGQRLVSEGDEGTARGDRLALLQVARRLVELASARAPDGSQLTARWRRLERSESQPTPLVELAVELPAVRPDAAGGERVFDAPLHNGQIEWTEGVPTVRDVVREHRGELWVRATPDGSAYVLVLPAGEPIADRPVDLASDAVGRQVLALLGQEGFYHPRPAARTARPAHAEALLSDLSFAVFDLETTGLEPGLGDEIVSIGAVRVRDGQVIREDHFFSLVDPGRRVPAASTRIHGITPAMVAGQPRIEAVLPLFLEFVGDSVPVAHVASFDLAFINPRLERLGRPPLGNGAVLDTLLLTYSLFPNWDGYNLEEIAARFEVRVVGRHTSLGDALATAEIFLRLLVVLEQRGVKTLGELLKLQGGDVARKAVGAVRARLAWG